MFSLESENKIEHWVDRERIKLTYPKICRSIRKGWFLDLLKIICPWATPFLNMARSSSGSRDTCLHASEQHPFISAAHLSHWINRRWHPSFLQLVCVSQGAPHWWQWAITASEMRYPSRSSNTKFFPINFRGRFSSLAFRAYSMIPPSTWYTFLNPL